MTNKILDRLYQGTQEDLFQDILHKYNNSGFVLVSYVYFASIIINNLLGENKTELENKCFKTILKSDYILPDGIALQIIYKKFYRLWLANLNGTDLSENLVDYLEKSGVQFNLIGYGGHSGLEDKIKKYIFDKHGVDFFYFQNGFTEFEFEKLENLPGNSINVMFCSKGPKDIEWLSENYDKISKYRIIFFAQGGTFDFWGGYEKRAPKLVRMLKGEWVWRVLVKPLKNYKKFFISIVYFCKLLLKKTLN